MNWNQPCCDDCWEDRNPRRQPTRVRHATGGDDLERCAWCGVDTDSGIFVRADPATVAYPAGEQS